MSQIKPSALVLGNFESVLFPQQRNSLLS